MRGLWSLLLIVAAALSPVASAADAVPPGPAYALADTAVLTVRSEAGEAYRLFVAWPDGPPPAAGWPVLYLLDGEDQFAIATLTARRYARASARSGVGPGIVVGIAAGPLARRVRDYTPDAGADPIPAGAPAHGFATGGADAFLTFVATRVRPAVAAHWHVDSRRETLAGHSFGGLAALYDLHRFAHFDAYAAISPSLWYGGGAALPAIEPAARHGIRVLIASGSREGGPASGPGGERAAETLRAAGADARYDRLAGQSHGSTMLAAMGAIVELAFARGNSE